MHIIGDISNKCTSLKAHLTSAQERFAARAPLVDAWRTQLPEIGGAGRPLGCLHRARRLPGLLRDGFAVEVLLREQETGTKIGVFFSMDYSAQ